MGNADEYFDEDYVLSDILSQSEQFRRFYDAERWRIKNLKWELRPNHYTPASIETRLNDDEFEFTIVLKQIPVKLENDHMIAHEMLHGMINQEKQFPHISMKEFIVDDYKFLQLKKIQANVDSSIHDQLVNLRLSKYFDLTVVYEKTVQRIIHNSDALDIKYNRCIELYLSCWYICIMLLKDIILSQYEHTKIDDTFEIWFRGNYPLYTSAANEMLEIARLIDYAIPQNVEAFFNLILSSYNLGTYFFVGFSL